MNKRDRTAATIAKIQGISRQHAYRIWKDYKDGGIEFRRESCRAPKRRSDEHRNTERKNIEIL